MTDFSRKLADRFEDAEELAKESSDELGAHIFNYSERLVRALTEETLFPLPDEEAISIVESAIIKQRKWSPAEAKAKWGLALSILNDEKISLKLRR